MRLPQRGPTRASVTATGATCGNVRPYVEPDSQVSALPTFHGSVSTITNVVSAAAAADTPTPMRTSRSESQPPRLAANPTTTAVACSSGPPKSWSCNATSAVPCVTCTSAMTTAAASPTPTTSASGSVRRAVASPDTARVTA